MSIYTYNNYYGEETVNKEYKLFTFHPKGINIDLDQLNIAEDLFVTGKWIFNDCVLENLKFYFEYYIPKYTVAFLNRYSESNIGTMYFGISDEGIIQGIPFKGEINYSKINEMFNKVINSGIINCKINLKNNISHQIIKVDKNDNYDNISYYNIVERYLEEKEKYKKRLNKFILIKKKWDNLMKYYGNRLHLMLNDSKLRLELIHFIKSKDKKQYNVIQILKGNKIFREKTGEQIFDLKKRKDNPWYWICEFKDMKLEFLKSIKPKFPYNISNKLLPLNILTTIIDMIPIWLDKEDINLYLIKFTFKKPSIPVDISYKNNTGDLISCYRSLESGDPTCKPF